jgi:hypothetical protein
MHAAPLSSPRLARVLRLLADGKPHTTREIVRGARVMAVNACVAELRPRRRDHLHHPVREGRAALLLPHDEGT